MGPLQKDELISKSVFGETEKNAMLSPPEHAICLMSPRRTVPLTLTWQQHILSAMLSLEILKLVTIVKW
jgi:hypothetical protein